MFHWICPECGREIPPSAKECAACDPKAQPAPSPLETKAAPAPADPPPAAPEPEPLPDAVLALAEQVRAAQEEFAPEPETRMAPIAAPAPREVEAQKPAVTALLPPSPVIALLAPPQPALAPAEVSTLFAEPPPQPVAQAQATRIEASPAPPAVPRPTLLSSEPAAQEQPPSGSWLRLAPLQDYTAAATQAMRPAAPSTGARGADSGPRMTLPGPSLPPQLVALQNA